MIFSEKELQNKYPFKLSSLLSLRNVRKHEYFYYIFLITALLFILNIKKEKSVILEINSEKKDTTSSNLILIENIELKKMVQKTQNKEIFKIKKVIPKKKPVKKEENISKFTNLYALKGILKMNPVKVIIENKRTKETMYLKDGDSFDNLKVESITDSSIEVSYGSQTGEIR